MKTAPITVYTHVQPFTGVIRTARTVLQVVVKALDAQSAERMIRRRFSGRIEFLQVGAPERHEAAVRDAVASARATLAWEAEARLAAKQAAAAGAKVKAGKAPARFVLPACLRPATTGVDRSADLGRGMRSLMAGR